MKDKIGQIISARREEVGLSQRKLGASTGIPCTNISLWERGRGHIGIDDLSRIARALGKTASSMIAEAENG